MGYVGLREALKPGEVPEEKTMSYDRRPALVVDDDPEARKVLKDFLRLRGLAVLEARNGLEALLSVKQHRPGVVVLDLNMPRLGGLETLKDRKSTRLNSSHQIISYAVFCLNKNNMPEQHTDHA